MSYKSRLTNRSVQSSCGSRAIRTPRCVLACLWDPRHDSEGSTASLNAKAFEEPYLKYTGTVFKHVMRHKMTKTSKLLATVLAVLLVVLAVGVLLRSHHNATPHTFSEDELATATARNGEMTKEDYLRYARIDASAEKHGLITEEDLDWTLNLLKTPLQSSNPYAPALRRSAAMGVLKNVKNFTPVQEDEVYNAVLPMLASSNNIPASSNKLEKIGAIAVMKNIKDKRALPALTHLLEDSDPTVRSFAKRTIREINS